MNSVKRYRIKIEGVVQGVAFRYSAQKVAGNLGVSGFIRNMADGSVYAEAEAEEKKLKEFTLWCRKGPRAASVEKTDIEEMEIQNSNGFHIAG